MFTAILTTIPLWVSPLLFGLVWLGLRASKDRRVSPWLIYALPLLGLLSIGRATGLAQANLAAAALLLFYLIGAAAGYVLQARWIVSRSANRVSLRAEWVTMATILALFAVNFGAGMAAGIAPDVAQSASFALGFGTLAGGLSGSLMGRALRVARWPVSA